MCSMSAETDSPRCAGTRMPGVAETQQLILDLEARGLDPLALAWAAGLLEGEGSFYKDGRMGLFSVDRDVVERFAGIVRCGSVTPRKAQRPGNQSGYAWRCGGRSRRILAAAFYPWLGLRRREAS